MSAREIREKAGASDGILRMGPGSGNGMVSVDIGRVSLALRGARPTVF